MHQRRMNRPSTCLLGSGSVLGWLQVGVPQVEALENPSQVQDETPGRPEYDRALVRRGDLTINRGPNRSGANATPCCARLTCAGQDMIEAWIDEGCVPALVHESISDRVRLLRVVCCAVWRGRSEGRRVRRRRRRRLRVVASHPYVSLPVRGRIPGLVAAQEGHCGDAWRGLGLGRGRLAAGRSAWQRAFMFPILLVLAPPDAEPQWPGTHADTLRSPSASASPFPLPCGRRRHRTTR